MSRRKGRSRSGSRPRRPANTRPDSADAEAAAAEADSGAEVEAEASPPEARVWRFFASLGWFVADDLDAGLRELPLETQRNMLRHYGIQVEPRFAKGGAAALLAPRIRRTPWEELVTQFCGTLLHKPHDFLANNFGYEWDERLDELDLDALAAALLTAFPVSVARLVVALEGLYLVEVDHPVHRLLRDHPIIGFDDDVALSASEAFQSGEKLPAPRRVDDGSAPPQVDDGQTPRDGEQLPEEQPELFTPLDALLIRTTVATHTSTIGAPEPEELRLLVAELVALNGARSSSFFHWGFLRALDTRTPEVDVTGMNDDRWKWFRFGLLSGLVRQGNAAALVAAVLEDQRATFAVLTDEAMGWSVAGPVIAALLADHPLLAGQLLTEGPERFSHDESVCHDAFTKARGLLSERRPSEARALFRSLDSRAEQTTGLDGVELKRWLAACHRASGEFPAAESCLAEVAAIASADVVTPEVAAVLDVERGLIDARVHHLADVRPPTNEADREATRERLAPGRASFAEALQKDGREPRASYLLGVLALCELDFELAERHLEHAAMGMAGDEVFEGTRLTVALRYHLGLATISRLQPGTDSAALVQIDQALRDGYEPTADELTWVADALAAHASGFTGRFLALACPSAVSLAGIAPLVAREAERGDGHALKLCGQLATDIRISPHDRLAVLAAAVTGAGRTGDTEAVESLVDMASELVESAALPELDRSWATELATNDVLRATLDALQADAQRVEVFRRLGEYQEAQTVAEQLFHRVVSGHGDTFSPPDILTLLEELEVPSSRIDELSRRLPTAPVTERQDMLVANECGEVRIVFVGGNETQQQYRDAIVRTIDEQHGGAVHVEWFFPGWSSNWSRDAERAQAALADANALVLMTYVRTNLGRRMRRVASELDKPWISCTGHGAASIAAAIDQATAVARRLAQLT